MRNLKKVLSLTLALVMLLGMMVVGAGATSFKDDDKIADEYKVAAAVLDKIGVMKGTELNGETNFNPTKSLTRVEGAALIYRLVTGGLSMNPSGESGFTDVDGTPNHGWASGTVAACRDLGIVSGESATTFNPGGELTVSAFAKMLLVTLGYEDKYAGYSGEKWETNVARDARARGILLNGLTMNAKLTREQAAQMAFQALTAEMVEYTGMNVTIGDTALNSPATVRLHSSDKFGETTYTNVPATATTPIRLCEERFPDLKLAKTVDDETFGRTLSVWTWKRVEIGGTETNVTPDAVFTAETNENGAKAAIGKAVGTADLYMNGNLSRQYISAKVIADELAENGRLVEVYLAETDKTKVEKVVVVDTALGEITKVDSKNEKITIKLAGSDVVLGSPNLTTKVGYGEFEKGDMVVVTGYNAWNSGNDTFYNNGKVQTTVDTVAEATVVTGLAKFKDNKNATITIDGTAYEMAVGLVGGQEESFTAFKLHKTKDSTLYLYELGGVEYVIKAVPGEDVKGPVDNLIAVTSSYKSLVSGKIVNMVEGVLSNGQTVTWQTKNEVDPSTDTTQMYYYYYATENDTLRTLKKVVATTTLYTTSDKNIGDHGRYFFADVMNSDSGTYDYTSTGIKAVALDAASGSNLMYADDVKFIFVENGTGGTADVTVMNGQQNVSFDKTVNGSTVAYAVREGKSAGKEITAVYLTTEPDVYDVSDIIYIHEPNPRNDQWVETTDGNKIYYGYVAYDANGELIEDFRGDEDERANLFIRSKATKINDEYVGYSMAKKGPKGTTTGKLITANGLGGNAFILDDGEAGYYTNTNTKVVDLTGKGLDSVKEINKAFNNNTYKTIKVALIYTGKTEFVAKTVFVYEVSEKSSIGPSGDSGVKSNITAALDNTQDPAEVVFSISGTADAAAKADAIKKAIENDGVTDEIDVKYLGGGKYRVIIDGQTTDYVEGTNVVVGGVPTPKKQYDMIQDTTGLAPAVKEGYETLANSDTVSHNAEITPKATGSAEIKANSLVWNAIPAGTEGVTVPNFGTYKQDLKGDGSVTVTHYALVPIVSGDNLHYKIAFKTSDSPYGIVAVDGTTDLISVGFMFDSVTYKIVK